MILPFGGSVNLNSIECKSAYCIEYKLIKLRAGSFKLQTWTSIGKWFKYMRQAATTVNRIDVYICPSSRTLNAFQLTLWSMRPLLYLIRAFSVTILCVAASFSLEKNKSGFQICLRTSECTVSTSICVSLIVSFRPLKVSNGFPIIISALLRYRLVTSFIQMQCTVKKTRQIYCNRR